MQNWIIAILASLILAGSIGYNYYLWGKLNERTDERFNNAFMQLNVLYQQKNDRVIRVDERFIDIQRRMKVLEAKTAPLGIEESN